MLYLGYPQKSENAKDGGSNEKFHDLQAVARDEQAELGRKVSFRQITRHFEFNAGREYKTNMKLDTKTFEEAPGIFKKCKNDLTHLITKVLEKDPEFNEALTCEYWNGMGMNLHDDGEEGLGEVVASLSLGSRAQMRFAMKSAYRYGRVKKGKDIQLAPDDPVLPGCEREKERRELLSKKEQGELSEEEFKEQMLFLLQDLPLVERKILTVLKCLLPHGAFMCMAGRGMQKFFEHEIVDLKGLMRFAITCRHIGDTHGQRTAKAEPRKGTSSTNGSQLGQKRKAQGENEE